nr:putative ribonuclease h protein [Quercus suber]
MGSLIPRMRTCWLLMRTWRALIFMANIWIWKLKTLPKIQIFLWKCLHLSLLVKSILALRGISSLGGCENCFDNEESITHVLRDCPIAKYLWGGSSCPSSLKQSFSGDLVTWIQTNARSSTQASGKDYDWNSFFLFSVWNLWLQRNRKAFKQQAPNPNLVKVVEMQVKEFLYCVVETSTERARHVKQVRWSKPVEGWLKLNTNGLVISTSGLSRCGGLIRDSAGKWVVGFAKSINVNSSIAVELWALREGLILCIECEAHAVEIELDASTAISLVAGNVNTNGDLSGLIDDCKELLLQLPQVKLSHCFKEANFCADALVRLGSASSDIFYIFVTPPPAISQLLFSDMMGLYRPRICINTIDVGVS